MKTTLKFLSGWMMLCLFQPLFAQNLMVIHQGNGTKIQLPLESIDSIRFVSLPPPVLQKIFQNNGNVLSLAISDIDSITYDLPNPQSLPQVSTQSVSALGTSSVYAQGGILSEGSSPVTKRGFCWSLQPMPSLANNFTSNGSGTSSFGANILPLLAGTLYYVRAYATNSSGTAYGAQLTVSTEAPSSGGNLPTVITTPVQYIPNQGLTAFCGGNVTADGGLSVTARGVCWAAGCVPTLNNNFTLDGIGGGSFSSYLSNLLPNTTYYVRAYATNDAGTVYGVSFGFTTANLPQLITKPISNIFYNSAKSGGEISTDGGSSITSKGVCWSTTQNPSISLNTKTIDGIGAGPFESILPNLSPQTTFYIRAYATNSIGTSYGNQQSFFTSSPPNTDSLKILLTGGSRKTWRLDSLSSAPIIAGLEANPSQYYTGGPLAPCQKDDWVTFTLNDSIYVNCNGSTLQPSLGYICGSQPSFSANYAFGPIPNSVAGLAQINLEANNPNQWIGLLDRAPENVYRILDISPNSFTLRCGNGLGVVHTLKFVRK